MRSWFAPDNRGYNLGATITVYSARLADIAAETRDVKSPTNGGDRRSEIDRRCANNEPNLIRADLGQECRHVDARWRRLKDKPNIWFTGHRWWSRRRRSKDLNFSALGNGGSAGPSTEQLPLPEVHSGQRQGRRSRALHRARGGPRRHLNYRMHPRDSSRLPTPRCPDIHSR